MKHTEPGREPRNAAGRDPDRVVDELRAERDLELQQLDVSALPAEPRDRHEAVEIARLPGQDIEVDPVPTAQ